MSQQQQPQRQRRHTLIPTADAINGVKDRVISFMCSTTDKIVNKYPLMNGVIHGLQVTTGLSRKHLLLFLASIPICLFAFMYFTPFALSISTLLYPLYMSIKSIEKKCTQEKTRWLLYWLLYNAVMVVENLFGFVLFVLPGYGLIRGCYFAWCMAPTESNGSIITYYMVRPYVARPFQLADTAFKDATAAAKTKFQDVVDEPTKVVKQVAPILEALEPTEFEMKRIEPSSTATTEDTLKVTDLL